MDPVASVRQATVRDMGLIASIERASFGTEARFSDRQLRYLLTSPHASWWIASEQAAACWLTLTNGRAAWARLYSLAVHPDARGQGLARTLLRLGLTWLQERGIRRCFAEVAEDNDAARRLYRQIGFRERGCLADYYAPGQAAVRLLFETPETCETAPAPSSESAGPNPHQRTLGAEALYR